LIWIGLLRTHTRLVRCAWTATLYYLLPRARHSFAVPVPLCDVAARFIYHLRSFGTSRFSTCTLSGSRSTVTRGLLRTCGSAGFLLLHFLRLPVGFIAFCYRRLLRGLLRVRFRTFTCRVCDITYGTPAHHWFAPCTRTTTLLDSCDIRLFSQVALHTHTVSFSFHLPFLCILPFLYRLRVARFAPFAHTHSRVRLRLYFACWFGLVCALVFVLSCLRFAHACTQHAVRAVLYGLWFCSDHITSGSHLRSPFYVCATTTYTLVLSLRWLLFALSHTTRACGSIVDTPQRCGCTFCIYVLPFLDILRLRGYVYRFVLHAGSYYIFTFSHFAVAVVWFCCRFRAWIHCTPAPLPWFYAHTHNAPACRVAQRTPATYLRITQYYALSVAAPALRLPFCGLRFGCAYARSGCAVARFAWFCTAHAADHHAPRTRFVMVRLRDLGLLHGCRSHAFTHLRGCCWLRSRALLVAAFAPRLDRSRVPSLLRFGLHAYVYVCAFLCVCIYARIMSLTGLPRLYTRLVTFCLLRTRLSAC